MKLDTIITNRLILRPFSPDDLEAYLPIMTNPQVTRFLGSGKDKTPEDVRQVMELFMQYPQEHGFGVWAVLLRESEKLIGHCGFLALEDGSGVELLYAFDPTVWGKGIASEAAQICLDYARQHGLWEHLYALAYPENAASIRVLEKLGFYPDGDTFCFGQMLKRFLYKL